LKDTFQNGADLWYQKRLWRFVYICEIVNVMFCAGKCSNYQVPFSGIVSFTSESPSEVTHIFHGVQLDLLVQN
jgi:hypothetical protein